MCVSMAALCNDEQAQHDKRDRRAHVQPFQPRRDQPPQHEAARDDRERAGIQAVFHDELHAYWRAIAICQGSSEPIRFSKTSSNTTSTYRPSRGQTPPLGGPLISIRGRATCTGSGNPPPSSFLPLTAGTACTIVRRGGPSSTDWGDRASLWRAQPSQARQPALKHLRPPCSGEDRRHAVG